MKANEFREKTGAELQGLLKEKQDSLIRFRIQMATGVVDNVRLAREARHDIARIKTVLHERELAAAGETDKGSN